jgi:hypothetical protein
MTYWIIYRDQTGGERMLLEAHLEALGGKRQDGGSYLFDSEKVDLAESLKIATLYRGSGSVAATHH